MNDGFVISMLNRCALTDNTGNIRLTLWGDIIQQVTNNKSYNITDVRVKHFEATKYLTCTPNTQVTPVDKDIPPPTQDFFDALFENKTIHAPKVHLADTFKTWLSCTKCAKQITDITSTNISLIKCQTCSVVQTVSSCTLNASLRIAVTQDQDNEHLWLRVFTPQLQTMLQHVSPDVTLKTEEEDIYTQLFQLANFTIEYNEQSLIVKNVQF